MPVIYRVLGQSAPSATTDTNIYTAPTGRSAVVSTITICNRSGTLASYRIAVRPAGAAIANQHYLAFDIAIAPNDTTALTIGVSLATSDVVTVFASSADLTFNVFGSEIF